MSALTVTASQVLPGANAQVSIATAAVAITAGQAVYLNASGQWALADADDATAIAANATKGIAINGGAAGQPVSVVTSGDVTIGAGAAPGVGVVYVVGATAGAINPAADLTTNWQTTILGVGAASNVIKVNVFNSGQIHA